MSGLVIVPILLPLVTALLMAAGGLRRVGLWQQPVSTLSVLALAIVAAVLLGHAAAGELTVYQIGDWPPRYGIVLVLDRLSALMVLLTAVVAACSLIYGVGGADRDQGSFHALFHFQLAGLNAAFLTGDLFNLFVAFELLLIASYALLMHGAGPERSRAGLHYAIINLVGSSLFLIAIGLIYGVTGRLNMADLAAWTANTDLAQQPVLRVAGAMLLVVFGLKAALAPLYPWLPSAYSAASAPVAALFSIMTKVGIYAMLRMWVLITPDRLGGEVGAGLLIVGMGTLLLGNFGAIACSQLRRTIGYLLIGSVGTLVIALAIGTAHSIAAGLYYLLHSTLLAAALFLLADLVAQQRGPIGDVLRAGPGVAQPVLLGLGFLVAAAAYAGLPPFSGFIGKLLILQSAWGSAHGSWIWATVLVTGLFATIALSRAGSMLFWKSEAPPGGGAVLAVRTAPVLALLALSMALAAVAGPVMDYADATARQLLDRDRYLTAVLGAPPSGATGSHKP
jgi:multicomponent K+:H+ antiporter subunit D